MYAFEGSKMKKLLLLVAVAAISSPVMAKSPEAIGTIFAQVDACKIQGYINKPQSKLIKLKVTDKYNVIKKSKSQKNRITKGQFKEFERIKKQGDLGRAIKCKVLENKWLG